MRLTSFRRVRHAKEPTQNDHTCIIQSKHFGLGSAHLGLHVAWKAETIINDIPSYIQ